MPEPGKRNIDHEWKPQEICRHTDGARTLETKNSFLKRNINS